jgi:hypothetical protein
MRSERVMPGLQDRVFELESENNLLQSRCKELEEQLEDLMQKDIRNMKLIVELESRLNLLNELQMMKNHWENERQDLYD